MDKSRRNRRIPHIQKTQITPFSLLTIKSRARGETAHAVRRNIF
jgi:hypothetical protein